MLDKAEATEVRKRYEVALEKLSLAEDAEEQAQAAGYEADVRRIRAARTGLADAYIDGIVLGGWDGDAPRVKRLAADIESAYISWANTGAWPALTIRPGGPPRDDADPAWVRYAKIGGAAVLAWKLLAWLRK